MGDTFRRNRKQRRDRNVAKHRAPKVPALPVFLWADGPDINGVVARYMFPVSGVVEYALVMAEEFEGDSVPMTLEAGDIQHSFFAYKKPLKDKIDQPLPAGTRIVLKTSNLLAKGFWIAFSWRPTG